MRAAAAVPLVVAMGACGERGAAPARSASAPAPAEAPSRPPLAAAGVTLRLGPNLAGVAAEDLPDDATRDVEILEFDGRRLRLRWASAVRVESPASSARREAWVRAVSAAPSGATPLPTVEPEYERREIGGTLDLPDFGTATVFLLPGLWPEGSVTVRNTAALWLPDTARRGLDTAAGAALELLPTKGLVLRDPAATLLFRAASLDRERERRDPAEPPPGTWRALADAGSAPLFVKGRSAVAPTLRARDWFGVYDVLAQDGNPLVVAATPDPVSTELGALFAPSRVLRTLLSYRVLSIEPPPTAKPAKGG